MSELGLLKCRKCHYFDEKLVANEKGEKEWKLYCGRTGKELPSYDYSPKGCLGFVWSSDAWREYAE